MFQFARLSSHGYVFRHGYPRITTDGFPHSEIPGSRVGQHLPRAYRSHPRPSSALGAKASTVCPCSLDSERTSFVTTMEFSRCARANPAEEKAGHAAGLSKLNSVERRGRRCSRRARSSDDPPGGRPSTSRAPTGVMAPASLERR